jgi:hypothetical protein
MTKSLFNPGREGIANGEIIWGTHDVRCMLVKSTYSFDATDKFISDLGAVDNGRSEALGTKTYTNGFLDAANTTITATAATACNAIIFFKHTGDDATARLIGYDDEGTGFPFTPAVSQVVNVTFDDGANKILKV